MISVSLIRSKYGEEAKVINAKLRNAGQKTEEEGMEGAELVSDLHIPFFLLYNGEYLWPCFQHDGSSRYRAIAVPAINTTANDKKRSRRGSKAAEGPNKPWYPLIRKSREGLEGSYAH